VDYMLNGLVLIGLSRNHRIAEIMKLEKNEPIEFIEISRYTKDFLEMQTDAELIRIEHMLNFLKQAQNQNA